MSRPATSQPRKNTEKMSLSWRRSWEEAGREWSPSVSLGLGKLREKQLFTSWRIDCHYDYQLPHSDTVVTGLRLEIWLANPAAWDEILGLSEDQGKLCWGRGVNWSVTPFPIWMTSWTNENHCSPPPHSPALHKSLFGGHWLWKQCLVS